jgi:hypothetical protein
LGLVALASPYDFYSYEQDLFLVGFSFGTPNGTNEQPIEQQSWRCAEPSMKSTSRNKDTDKIENRQKYNT